MSRPALEYNPEEPKTEDLDLLTASDIRASAGRISNAVSKNPAEKQKRREVLEDDYRNRPQSVEKRLEAEITASRKQSEEEMVKEIESIAKDVQKRDAAQIVHEQVSLFRALFTPLRLSFTLKLSRHVLYCNAYPRVEMLTQKSTTGGRRPEGCHGRP